MARGVSAGYLPPTSVLSSATEHQQHAGKAQKAHPAAHYVVVGTVHSHFFWHMHFIFSHVHCSSWVCAPERSTAGAREEGLSCSEAAAHLAIGLHPLARLQKLGHRLAWCVLLLLLPPRLLLERHVPHLRRGGSRCGYLLAANRRLPAASPLRG